MTQKILVKKVVLLIMAFFLTTPLLGLSKRSADKDSHNASTVRPANIVMDIAGIPAGQGKQYAKAFAAASAVKSLTEIGTNKLFKDPISNSTNSCNSATEEDSVETARKFFPSKDRSSLLVSQSIATLVALRMLTGNKQPLSLIRSIPTPQSILLLANLIIPLLSSRTHCNAQQLIRGYVYIDFLDYILSPLLWLTSPLQVRSLTKQIEHTLDHSDWHRGMRAPASFAQDEYIILESPWAVLLGATEHWGLAFMQKLSSCTITWILSSRYYIKTSALRKFNESTQSKILAYSNWTLAKQIGHLALSPLGVGQQIEKEYRATFTHVYKEMRGQWVRDLNSINAVIQDNGYDLTTFDKHFMSPQTLGYCLSEDLQVLIWKRKELLDKLATTPETPSSLRDFNEQCKNEKIEKTVRKDYVQQLIAMGSGLYQQSACSSSNSVVADDETYTFFGITPKTSRDDARKAIMKKSRECHPDRGGSLEQFNKFTVQRAAINKKHGWDI